MSYYLFALVDGGGTVPPELGAARRLVARGHRVQVLAEDSMRDEVVGTGAVFLPWVRGVNVLTALRSTTSCGTGSAALLCSCSSACSTRCSLAPHRATRPIFSSPSTVSDLTWWCARSSPSVRWSRPRLPASALRRRHSTSQPRCLTTSATSVPCS